MNPSNGLLACRTCDAAFEHHDIAVDDDLGVDVSKDLRASPNGSVRAWARSIAPEIRVRGGASFPPDPKYLKWKRSLGPERGRRPTRRP